MNKIIFNKEINIEKEMSLEDRKLLKEYRKHLKEIKEIITKVRKSKIYNNDRKKLFEQRLWSAKGHCENQIKIIKKKYLTEEVITSE